MMYRPMGEGVKQLLYIMNKEASSDLVGNISLDCFDNLLRIPLKQDSLKTWVYTKLHSLEEGKTFGSKSITFELSLGLHGP